LDRPVLVGRSLRGAPLEQFDVVVAGAGPTGFTLATTWAAGACAPCCSSGTVTVREFLSRRPLRPRGEGGGRQLGHVVIIAGTASVHGPEFPHGGTGPRRRTGIGEHCAMTSSAGDVAPLTWQIGDVTITRVVERESRITGAPALPTATPEEIEAIGWLRPTWLSAVGEFRTSIYSLLVQTPTRRVVVDTGLGNGKTRRVPSWNNLNSDFLERFDAVWPRDTVDDVICTHLHIDHVGWNTKRVEGRWVPTFPNARYHFVRAEYEHWSREFETPPERSRYSEWAQAMIDGPAVYADSIKPVVDAGVVDFVAPDASIVAEIRLQPTPGHTPGHVSVGIESGGERAVISGDLFHFPCQIARPDWSSSLDHDQEASAETRRAFLTGLADTSTLLFGSHFAAPTAGRVVTDGDTFRLVI
jgi:glyoxylase-like metal-dependent hydrolase (beta-lactamase superfamily II)